MSDFLQGFCMVWLMLFIFIGGMALCGWLFPAMFKGPVSECGLGVVAGFASMILAIVVLALILERMAKG